MRLLRFFAVSLCLLTCRDAQAYRPFDGTDAEVAETGEFELEFGPVHYFGSSEGRYLIAPATVLNLGFAHDWELVIDAQNFVGLTSIAGERRDRVLDTDILTKVVIRPGTANGATGVGVACEFGPLLPNIHGQDGFGASADFIFSYRWPALTMYLNVDPELSRLHNAESFTSLIVEGPRTWPVRPAVELYVEHEFTVGTIYSGLVGAIWEAHKDFALDVALRGAFDQGSPVVEVRLGFTWAIPVWEAGPAEVTP